MLAHASVAVRVSEWEMYYCTWLNELSVSQVYTGIPHHHLNVTALFTTFSLPLLQEKDASPAWIIGEVVKGTYINTYFVYS